MFNEECIYEAKLTKLDEIEELMREVAEFYLEQDGVIDVHYIKRTHRQKDFNAVKEGELPVRLTRGGRKRERHQRCRGADGRTHQQPRKRNDEKHQNDERQAAQKVHQPSEHRVEARRGGHPARLRHCEQYAHGQAQHICKQRGKQRHI